MILIKLKVSITELKVTMQIGLLTPLDLKEFRSLYNVYFPAWSLSSSLDYCHQSFDSQSVKNAALLLFNYRVVTDVVVSLLNYV